MRIFITGATGFIGSHVAFELLNAGHELVAAARNPDKLPELSRHPRVHRVTARLTERAPMRDALQGCEACVHIALGWGDTPVDMLMQDTLPSVALLEDCAAAGVQRFVYTSSTAALGPFFERMNEAHPTRPNDYYGATKAATESFVLAVGAKTGMRCNVIRPGYTFGNPVVAGAPTQPDPRFRDIARAARENREIRVTRGDGTQFVWAGDLARLYRAVLESEHQREVYYGLGQSFVSWEQVAARARELSGSSSPIVLEEPREPVPPGRDARPNLFELSKIAEHFGLSFDAQPRIDEHLAYFLAEPS
ncbi:MAG TPA: NAD(P)-dependent oxidoreductase [Polyangiaceae bacterium]|nr:NAD(P)-dependent oxidoreductase [Polyangiaceae bacterium]